MAQAAPASVAPDAAQPPMQVEHDKKRRQFVIRLNGSHDRAVLLYEYVGKKTVDLQHTEVPDAYRGRGIAKHLAKAAMDFVVEEDLKAHLTCCCGREGDRDSQEMKPMWWWQQQPQHLLKIQADKQ
ncbi:unnamed protein product [Pleuronectes platessa]|uniref:Protein NATD1 n=1 Tax=Pleuronectes platessa TaxID=8262 RepID=A0A9N7V9X4_PLEPL|nr:unnamed protein product [Pleuronectes platessa]